MIRELIDKAALLENTEHLAQVCIGQGESYCERAKFQKLVKDAPTVDAVPKPHWIPIKTRPMDEDERNYYSEHFGYDIEYEEAIMFDCKMPEDGQEVWVCYKNGTVSQDVCENDDGMVSLEGNGDWDYIVAWMPIYKPEPYKGDEEQDG